MIQKVLFSANVSSHQKDFRWCQKFDEPLDLVYEVSLLQLLKVHYGDMWTCAWICSLTEFKED